HPQTEKIKVEFESAVSPTTDGIAPPNTISAAAPQPPVADATLNSTAANATSSALSALPAQRSRLPAELSSQIASSGSRRPVIEVDSARLLTRVARAFTAAQERDGEVRLRLSPPELGSLRLEVRVQDGALVARLQTETDAARTAIIDNLPALRDRLAEQGVRIERFDVDLMQRQPGGMPDQPGGRQHDLPSEPFRAVVSPRPRAQTQTSGGPSTPNVGPADGVNVTV